MSGGENQELVTDDGKRAPSNCACCSCPLADGETESCRECGGVCCDDCCFLGRCDDCVDEDDNPWDDEIDDEDENEDDDWDDDDDLEDDLEDEDDDFDDLEDDGDLDDEPSDGFGEDDDF